MYIPADSDNNFTTISLYFVILTMSVLRTVSMCVHGTDTDGHRTPDIVRMVPCKNPSKL